MDYNNSWRNLKNVRQTESFWSMDKHASSMTGEAVRRHCKYNWKLKRRLKPRQAWRTPFIGNSIVHLLEIESFICFTLSLREHHHVAWIISFATLVQIVSVQSWCRKWEITFWLQLGNPTSRHTIFLKQVRQFQSNLSQKRIPKKRKMDTCPINTKSF